MKDAIYCTVISMVLAANVTGWGLYSNERRKHREAVEAGMEAVNLAERYRQQAQQWEAVAKKATNRLEHATKVMEEMDEVAREAMRRLREKSGKE